MADSLHNAPIVLDNGSGTIRAGFAGEDLPKCYFPSFVGRPKHLRVLAGALEGEVFIGQKAATELRGLLKIRYPLEHGIVTDWDDMEKIWGYVYDEGLKTLSEEVRCNSIAGILHGPGTNASSSIPSSSQNRPSTLAATVTPRHRSYSRHSTSLLYTHPSKLYYRYTPPAVLPVSFLMPATVFHTRCRYMKASP